MKIKGTFYLNSGLIINEESELGQEEIEGLTEVEIKTKATVAIDSIEDDFLRPCFQKNINAYLKFGDTSFRLSDVSATKFMIAE